MNIRLLPLALFAALLAAGPGGLELPFAVTSAAAADKAGSPRVIEITGNEDLKVVFTNTGTLPKEAMGHNWVLLKAGTDVNAFATAAMTAKATEYIPPAHKDKVIASTPVLGPKQKAEVAFKAPAAGTYTYICSFPGHYMIMRGTLTVK
jgi:azurin